MLLLLMMLCSIGAWAQETMTVTFVDEDGTTVLDEAETELGKVPVFGGTAPTKAATDEYAYTFAGWSTTPGGSVLDPLPAADADVTYYAVFTRHSDGSEIVNTKELPCVYAMPDYDIDVTMTAVPDPADFEQTAANEYTIHTTTGWGVFCDLLAGGTSFSGKTVKLGDDIGSAESPVTRMAASWLQIAAAPTSPSRAVSSTAVCLAHRPPTAAASWATTTARSPSATRSSPPRKSPLARRIAPPSPAMAAPSPTATTPPLSAPPRARLP